MKFRTEAEKAQRELNEILERVQTPEQFEYSVQQRIERMQQRTAQKEAKKHSLSANQSLFRQL